MGKAKAPAQDGPEFAYGYEEFSAGQGDQPGQGDGVEVVFDSEQFTAKLTEQTAEAFKVTSAKLADAVASGISAGFEKMHDPATEGPKPVAAARFRVGYEPPVYSFDGQAGRPSFVRDSYHAKFSRDDDAIDRLRKFDAQNRDLATQVAARARHANNIGNANFAAITTTSASDIIPPGYRPDLFVPQITQGRPIVSSFTMAAIDNASPFTIPRFVSTSGVGDHTEGTNPSDGTLVVDTITVSPGAISGTLLLTREIVDSSNPAIDLIAVNVMRESYAQQTEAKAYALLNGSSGQGGTLTGSTAIKTNAVGAHVYQNLTAGADVADGAELLGDVRTMLANYPFWRFASPNTAMLSQRATTMFATAVDDQNRPLLASTGAVNSAGVGNAASGGWYVDGLPFVPAYAMTGVAATDADVLIYNSADVYAFESGLLSFRYEEKQGPANIQLALFGYFGCAVLRGAGLASVRITKAAS